MDIESNYIDVTVKPNQLSIKFTVAYRILLKMVTLD